MTQKRKRHSVKFKAKVALEAASSVLAWRLSTTLDTPFCLNALNSALADGQPCIFNTDQGCQFTRTDFTA